MAEKTERGPPDTDPAFSEGIPEAGVQPREKWANKMEFIFSMAGEIIGLGNIWRFPYLCFKNGGGVFLIPYFVFLFFCGIPLFFLETALGQYTSEGGVTAWRKICPMFQGIGVASQVIVTYLNIYYIVVLAWAIFYLVNSFKSPPPWSTCDNAWNTKSCLAGINILANPHVYQPNTSWSFLNNITTENPSEDLTYLNESDLFLAANSPEEEFWINRVLRLSDGMSMTTLHWDLALCLLLAWVMCYFCIWKGIKFTGKCFLPISSLLLFGSRCYQSYRSINELLTAVTAISVVYFTATFPYLLLFIIFIRGVSLPGAGEGLRFYLTPDFSKLADPNVWSDAGTQVFFSYAVCQGVLTSLGSYNKYNNNCYRDCLALCFLNSFTSIFAGFAVFSVLGFMAHGLDLPLHDVAVSGPGLAFIAYPKALSMLPGSSFWAVLFFLMILFLGLDTQFVCVESLATSITDLYPRQLRKPGARELLVLAIATVCFLLGLPLVAQGGIVLFQLMDTFGASGLTLLFIACCETIAVAWVYGADRFYDNIEDMIGYPPLPLLKYCWLFITPLICGFTMLYNLAQGQSIMVYGYLPGAWASVVGSLLIITPLMCIPVFLFISLCKNSQTMTTPSSDLLQARPHKPPLTLCGCVVVRSRMQPNRREDGYDKTEVEETTGV